MFHQSKKYSVSTSPKPEYFKNSSNDFPSDGDFGLILFEGNYVEAGILVVKVSLLPQISG